MLSEYSVEPSKTSGGLYLFGEITNSNKQWMKQQLSHKAHAYNLYMTWANAVLVMVDIPHTYIGVSMVPLPIGQNSGNANIN